MKVKKRLAVPTFILSIIGYAVLSFITLLLFIVSFGESLNHNHAMSVFKLLVLLALAYKLFMEGRDALVKNNHSLRVSFDKKDAFFTFASVFIGTLVTFVINTELGLGPVVAASTVAILATLIFPKYDVPIYCGAFVGMACPFIFYNYILISIAGTAAGIVFIISKKVLNGYGGKLGTIAFTGCVTTTLISGVTPGADPIPVQETHLPLILYSAAGAVLTYLLNNRLKNSPVISSGIIGLIGGLFLPIIHPQYGLMYAIMVICASFAGMSAISKVPNEALIILAGISCALFFIYTSSYLGGTGGKLGTIAFGSVIAMRGIYDLINLAYGKIREKYVHK